MAFTSLKGEIFSISNVKKEKSSTLKFRLAQKGDLSFLRSLAHSFAVFGPYEKIIPQWFKDPFVATFILEEGGRPLGFFMLGLLFPPWLCRTLDLMAIAVLPEKRRKGNGFLMVEQAKKIARRRGHRVLRAHVGCQNEPAFFLFKKSGFKVKRKIENYYPSGLAAFELIYSL